MDVRIEEVEKNTLKLEIEVGADVLEAGLEKAYKKMAKRFTIPGFRKGRAPRHMVERAYGAQVLYEGVIDEICPEYYEKAIKENDIHPVDQPDLDLVEIEKGKPFIFSATVVVKPEVKLGQYIGVEAPYKQVIVTGEEIEEELKSIADKNARIIPVEDRPSQLGDTVVIDFEGFIDGVPFQGGKAEGHSLELGSGQFIEGFEAQLVDRQAGDEVKVSVTFPEQYGAEELRSKDAVFDVKIQAVKKKELPEIDDEFAQDVSEFDTLEEYKADIRKKLTEQQEERSKTEFENELFKIVANGAQIDIPPQMIDRQAERNSKDFEARLAYQGMDLERYLSLSSSTRGKYEDSMRANAESDVRMNLVLDQIAKENGLEVTDEELDGEFRKRAGTYKKSFEEYKAQMTDDHAEYIRSVMKKEKVVAMITESAIKI